MNYQRIYQKLIERARYRVLDGYAERHHVTPKCMGGTNEITNIVSLTPEEHFFAHVLLVKIHPEQKNLVLAVQKMTVSSRTHKGLRRSRKLYGWLKRKFAVRMRELQSGEGNSQFGSRWINDGNGTAKKHRGELPERWLEGRVLKNPKTTRVYELKVSQEEAEALLFDYESGLTMREILLKYNRKSEQSVTTFLTKRFPDRKRFAPNGRERYGLQV